MLDILKNLSKNSNNLSITLFFFSCLSFVGVNINIVSKFLGHTKIEETLNTYTHLYKKALIDITSLIDDMNEARNQS